MLRARPRLPAGPRTPKRTASVQPQAPLDDTPIDEQLPSDLSSSSVPLFSSSIALRPDVDLQREPPLPTLDDQRIIPSRSLSLRCIATYPLSFIYSRARALSSPAYSSTSYLSPSDPYSPYVPIF